MFEFSHDQRDELGRIAAFVYSGGFEDFSVRLEGVIGDHLIAPQLAAPTPLQVFEVASGLRKFLQSIDRHTGNFVASRLSMPLIDTLIEKAKQLEVDFLTYGPPSKVAHARLFGVDLPQIGAHRAAVPPSPEFILELAALAEDFGFSGGRPKLVPLLAFCCRAARLCPLEDDAYLTRVHRAHRG